MPRQNFTNTPPYLITDNNEMSVKITRCFSLVAVDNKKNQKFQWQFAAMRSCLYKLKAKQQQKKKEKKTCQFV